MIFYNSSLRAYFNVAAFWLYAAVSLVYRPMQMSIIFYSPRSVCLSKRPSRHRWSLGVYVMFYDGLMLEKGGKWPQLKSGYCMCTCIERFVENRQCFQFPSACHWPRNTLQHITKVLLAEDVEPGVRLSRDVFESLACMLCDGLSLSCFLDFCTKICRTISQWVGILCKLASLNVQTLLKCIWWYKTRPWRQQASHCRRGAGAGVTLWVFS